MHGIHLRIVALAALLLPAAEAAAQQRVPQSPREWTFHLQFGGYFPEIDSEAGLTSRPFERVFGDSDRVLTQAGLERSLFDAFGTLGLGVSAGYSEFYGKGFFAEGPNAGERSSDNTSFIVVPLQAFLAYRFDPLALRWGIPLVPFAKAGVGTWLWWTGGESGQRAGFSYGAGLQLHLDFFDPRLATEFDRNIGVNNSYLYVDWTGWQVDGFSSDGFDLSDDSIISFGLALDF
jgi:hypothetical protein